MNEIFEDYQSEKKKSIFSVLSFLFSLITLSFAIFIYDSIPSVMKPGQHFPFVPKWSIVALHSSCYLGLFFSLMSFVKKERLKYLKIISAVLNFLLLACIAGVILFAKVITIR